MPNTILLALAALVIQPPAAPSIDSLMVGYARPGLPGAAVLVVHGGRVVHAKGYGLADVEARVAVRPETSFRLASLSKHFTATAVMLLAADGTLAYDDAIGARLPELPAWAHAATVRHLLHHTSGLPDYEDFVPAGQARQVRDADVPALIARAESTYFAPGTRFRYSNTGYALLALLVERASGRRYADVLRERLFAPAGMSGAIAREDGGPPVPHRAYGYVVSAGAARRRDQSSTSAVLGDGGIYASIADLARWDAAIERHALVSADAQRLAWTPPALPAPLASSYGFGWFVDRDRGLLRVTHHGETSGFTNAVLRYPERRLAVWVLTNRAGGAPWTLAQRIAELFLER